MISGKHTSTVQTLLEGEHMLRSRTMEKRNVFTSSDARRHFNEGFVCRHYMLQSSRLFLEEHTQQKRKNPLSVYEATDCAIHANAYYLNLCGALDNLAWTLQYEWQLLSGVSEDNKKTRQQCSLRSTAFVLALSSRSSTLASVLGQHTSWYKDLTELRDPAAHRIPLYVPPAIMTTQRQMDEFRRIEAEIGLSDFERGGRSVSEIYQEARAAGEFAPLMITSSREGLQMRSIAGQVCSDHTKYLLVSTAVVDAL